MRLERRGGTPEPGQTVLLSAGPGAGKTWTLRRWQRSLGLPAVYLRLTPEDRDPAVLRHRLLRLLAPHLPERPGPAASGAARGAGLGMVSSVLAVLVDDWHALEGSESSAHLASFLWGLPHGSIVALASRHRFDDALALAAVRWPLDDPRRPEQPSLADLSALPAALRDLTLVLGLVGEAPPSPEGLELVRRNVACEGGGDRLALRPAWATLAVEALPVFATQGTWDAAEAVIKAFAERQAWTERHAEITALLARVPSEGRAAVPSLLALEGRQRFQEGAYGEALDCFERALRLKPRDPDLLSWRILALGMRDPRAAWEHLGELEVPASESSRTWELVLRSRLHWHSGNFAEAETSLRALLALPIGDDRDRARQHLMALFSLCELSPLHGDLSATYDQTLRMAELAKRWDFAEQMPWIVIARQKSALLDETRLPRQEHLTDVPNATCAGSLRTWVVYYLYNIATRANALGEPEIALRLFQLSERQTRGVQQEFGYMARWVRYGQVSSLMELGRTAEARERLAEFLGYFPTGPQHELAHLVWARIHLMRQELVSASEALSACSPAGPILKGRHHLYSEALRCLQGDAEAPERLRAWLETPEGAPMYTIDLGLLASLGLGTLPVAIRLSAFGPLRLFGEGGKAIRWGRRKAMLLFAWLLLSPEGIPAAELAERLCDDEGETTPSNLLHVVLHALRQALKGIGAEALLDTSQGVVRLDRTKIAFCDLFEFDGFYQRARSFEADGHEEMATVFFASALCHARGELFENLPEEFAEQRAAYRLRVRYAQTYVHRHVP